MSTPTLEQRSAMVDNAVEQIKGARAEVTDCIMVTPTGSERDALTDANIHLMAALEILKEYA